MSFNQLGIYTLDISFLIYLLYFVPQVIHNQFARKTKQLSLWLQVLWCVDYMLDLSYGLGRHMQWQYVTVDIVGLFLLFIQHLQIGRQIYLRGEKLKNYWLMSIFLIIVAILVFLVLFIGAYHHLNKIIDTNFINWGKVFINLGLFAQMIAFINFAPQIVKNFILKKAESLSIWFLLMAVLAIIFDEISAVALHWDYPSIVGPPLQLLAKLIIVAQIITYQKSGRKTG